MTRNCGLHEICWASVHMHLEEMARRGDYRGWVEIAKPPPDRCIVEYNEDDDESP